MTVAQETSLLRQRNFRTYFAGQAVAMMGTAVVPVAMGLVAVVTLHANGLAASIVSASSMLPALLLTLPIGAVVDRVDKRRIMMWADVGQGVAILAVPLLWWSGALSIPTLCVTGFVSTGFGIVSQVAHLSLTPHLVTNAQLIDANAKLSLADSAATTTGPMIAGFLVGRLGAPVTLGLGVLASFYSAFTLTRISSREQRPDGPVERATLRKDIAEGLRFVGRNVVLRVLMIVNSVDNFFIFWIQAVLVVYLVGALHWSPAAYGLVMGIAGLGGILGSLLVKRLHSALGTGKLLVAAVFFGGPCEAVVLLLSPGLAGQVLTCAAQCLAIFSTVCYNVTSRTLRQHESPDGLRSRITAAHRWVGSGLRPLGAVMGGVSTSVFGLYAGIAIGCVGLAIAPAVAWFSPLRHTDLTEAGKS
ncbi:MFS transporter [Amycolatopsis thailandensis]|uniref:MFS transporter n=1 Tax=Amycolatopsis thailandensis TaxID=589330 RepID=UPI00142DAD89|nr:MFS transporter [Amycolatopsis thailandensis]